jgi:hypothetical protein
MLAESKSGIFNSNAGTGSFSVNNKFFVADNESTGTSCFHYVSLGTNKWSPNRFPF